MIAVLNTPKHNELVFQALADPTRRLILDEFVERKEQTLYELTARLIMRHQLSISRQALAKHIDVLEKARTRKLRETRQVSDARLQR